MVQAKHLLGGVKECLEICQAGQPMAQPRCNPAVSQIYLQSNFQFYRAPTALITAIVAFLGHTRLEDYFGVIFSVFSRKQFIDVTCPFLSFFWIFLLIFILLCSVFWQCRCHRFTNVLTPKILHMMQYAYTLCLYYTNVCTFLLLSLWYTSTASIGLLFLTLVLCVSPLLYLGLCWFYLLFCSLIPSVVPPANKSVEKRLFQRGNNSCDRCCWYCVKHTLLNRLHKSHNIK